MRTSNEDECLRNDSHLKVDNHVDLVVIWTIGQEPITTETHTKLPLEEGGLHDDTKKGNTGRELDPDTQKK